MAIIAVARKLVTVAFLMLKNNEPYRYARPELMREKFTTVPAAGAEKKAKSARPRTKRKPSLDEVYQAAGLPLVRCPEELPAGEQRMLAERELEGFVAELYHPAEADVPAAAPQRGSQRSSTTGRPAGRPKK